MRNIVMTKKLFVLIVIAVLIIGFNFSIFASAHFDDSYKDEGILIDNFDDTTNVSFPDNRCLWDAANKRIILNNGSDTFTYNYSGQPDSIEVWEQSFGTEFGISQFISPDTVEGTKINETDMPNLKKVDDKRIITVGEFLSENLNYAFSPIQHFKFKTNQEKDNIKNIRIDWYFGSFVPSDECNLESISLWVWVYNSIIPHWKKIVPLEYVNDNFNNTFDPTISYYNQNDFKDWINDDGMLDFLIVGSPKSGKQKTYLYTDFIQLELTTKKGYLSDGTVVSSPISISPSDFGGWESVFWKSSKPSNFSSVTIQVLDENEKLIGELSSTASPLDISSVENRVIRLKAILRSKSPGITPYLSSWGVIWQKTDSYKDSFSTSYKISDMNGVKIQDGKVLVNEFSDEWSFFGKNPANYRSYIGTGLKSAPKNLYWYSKNRDSGGGFRQVVAKNGKVYVPGSDNRIHVFNAVRKSSSGMQKSINVSRNKYNVDAAIAVNDNYLIIGTCNVSSQNKIYALNLSDNLTGEKWYYPKGNETICFSAPITIDEGRLFVTSWSGRLWETPLLSFINKVFPGNNKLIGLDVETGEELWDPITLPAGSFSAPAVGDEMVFVGCQNMYGSSLFAFDIATGTEVWNQSVGMIGKSSPVYADGKVFVLSKGTSNISSSSKNKIIAVDAHTGEILWNKTIGGTNTMALLNVLKGFRFLKAIDTSAPIASPVFYDDTLIVVTPDGQLMGLSTDGEIKYDFNISKADIGEFYVTSPLVVNDKLYVTSGRSKVFCFNAKKLVTDQKPIWSYEIERATGGLLEGPPNIISSPIIANGLMFLSVTEKTKNLTGRVYSIGDYSKNTEGYIVSNPIHLPPGYWWNYFEADNVSSEKNRIIYSILDEKGNVLIDNLNGVKYNISSLKTNVIKLYASLTVGDDKKSLPQLNSWEVSWVEEDIKPEFIPGSFKPGRNGWVNQEISECSIEVRDKHPGASGIDVNSARYKIGYIESDTGKHKTSSWLEASSDDESGVKQTRIYAKLNESKLKIDAVLNITFSIKDLAGNENTSDLVEFKVDSIKPFSKFVGSYDEKHTQPFKIVVNASDDVNGSGLQKVYIKYRYKTSEEEDFTGEWEIYDSMVSPFIFYFEPEKSGYYQLISIAEDNASNLEEINNDKIADAIEVLFDMYKPALNTSFTTQRWKNQPEYEIEIYDDFKLDALYYRFDNQTQWTIIKDNIDNSTYKTTWQVPQDYWIKMRDGENHTVFFKITDIIGNEYISNARNSPKIIKDVNASSFYIDTSDFEQLHWDNKFVLKPECPEDTNITQIKLFYKYSKNREDLGKQNFTEYKNTSEEPFEIMFIPEEGSGYYVFYMEIIDSSGAVHHAYSDTVNITLFPAPLFIALIIILIILLILTMLILMKMRKKKQEL